LKPTELLAVGGEGAVYRKAGLIYKIYLDPNKAIRAGMEAKLPLLAQIRHPGIVSPQQILRNQGGKLLGFTMRDHPGEALCRVFTESGRQALGVTDSHVAKLATHMHSLIEVVHHHKALLVDANELNWLVAGRTEAAILDVDSWQIGPYPATAIMPSIRDWHSTSFSTLTDWYAWAIVTFQLWTGIHPFKGTHPDFSRNALESRMKMHVSVFDAKVRLPPAARSVKNIPPVLRDWYQGVFQSAQRSAPPPSARWKSLPVGPAVLKVQQTSNGVLSRKLITRLSGRIRQIRNGLAILESAQGCLSAWDLVQKKAVNLTPQTCLALISRKAMWIRHPDGVLLANLAEGAIQLVDGYSQVELAVLATQATQLWQHKLQLFGLCPEATSGLQEYKIHRFGSKWVLSPGLAWPVLAQAARCYTGVLVQHCLGAPFIGVVGPGEFVLGKAAQLSGYRILDGFAADRFNVWLAGIRVKDGESVLLRFGEALGVYQLETELVGEFAALSAAVTPNGVTVVVTEEGLQVSKGAHRKIVVAGLAPGVFTLFNSTQGIGAFEADRVLQFSLN